MRAILSISFACRVAFLIALAGALLAASWMRVSPPQAGALTATSSPTPTATPTPLATPVPSSEMHFVLPGGNCTGTPGSTPPTLKCTRLIGTNFHVQIQGTAALPVAGFQSETFLGGLTYTSKACSTEITMEPEGLCLGPIVGVGGQVSHGNITALLPPLPDWTNEPNLVEMPNVSCPSVGSFTLVLSAARSSGLASEFVDANGDAVYLQTRSVQILDREGPGGVPPLTEEVADVATVNCIMPPTSLVKTPALSNLWLTRQGSKIPPATCLQGDDTAVLTQSLSVPVSGTDKHGDPRSLGGFSFRVKYDPTKVCVTLAPGPGALNQGMLCTMFDSQTAPTLQGAATMFCVTAGKNVSPPLPGPENLELVKVTVRPQPEVYSLAKPNNGNGQVTQLLNIGCKLTDRQGDPIQQDWTSCTDADVTMRYLEGDVEPDCAIDGLDTQAVAFRWGAPKGSLLYQDRFNLEPPNPANPTGFDNDIDVNDLQFIYGRLGSTCENPQEEATPVNPKG